MEAQDTHTEARLRPQDWDLIVATFSILMGILYALEVYTDPMVNSPLLDIKHYEDLARSITDGTYSGAFFVDPFYLLVRAGIMGVFGYGFWPPILLNLIALALSAVALRRLGTRMVSLNVGLGAAFMLPLCKAVLFYQALAMKETLALAFLLWAMLLLMRFLDGEGRKKLVGAGVLMALAVLTRGNLLIMMPALVLPLLDFKAWKSLRAQSRAFIFVGAFILPIVPFTVWNYSQSGDVIPITYNLGNNFYQGNNPEYAGTDFYNPPFTGDRPALEEQGWREEMVRRQRKRCVEADGDCTQLTVEGVSPSALSRFWFAEGLDHVFDEPGDFVQRTTAKLLRLLSNSEVTNNIPIEYLAEQSFVLGKVAYGFGLLVLFALFGGFLVWPLMRHRRWVFGATLFYCVGVSVFYLITRLKIPLVPLLLIPAVAGVLELPKIMDLHPRRIGVALVVALLGGLMAFHPYEDRVGPGYVNLGNIYKKEKNWDAAATAYELAIKKDPKYAPAYLTLARIHLREGRRSEARLRVSDLEALIPPVKAGKRPQNAQVRALIGSMLFELKESHNAVVYLEQALAGGLKEYRVLHTLWEARKRLQQPQEFVDVVSKEYAAEAQPQVAFLWADALDFMGDYRGAAEVLKEAITRFPYERPLQERLSVIESKIRP
jgi:4-amino-4-deoxy-L-arabinose transferase-like glycosyltransferase